MPNLHLLLQGYNLLVGNRIGNAELVWADGQEETISRYHHYHYDIILKWRGVANNVSAIRTLVGALSLQDRVIDSEYGNPYFCQLRFKTTPEGKIMYSYDNNDKELIIYLQGDSYRQH